MSGKYTDEDLKGLSPEEIASLNDGDDGTDNDDILNDIAGDDEGDDDQGDSDDEGDDAAGTDTGTDAAKVDDPPADDPKPATVTSEIPDLDSLPAVNFVPKLSGELLPDYQAKADAVDEKYEAGDMTIKERDAAIRKLSAESQNEEVAGQLWKEEQATFKRHNADLFSDTATFNDLNAAVKRIATDPATSNLSGLQILYLAKQEITEKREFAEFRALKASGKLNTQVQDPTKTVIPPKPKTDKTGVQTLANVPSADMQEMGGGKFDYIDKLSGLDQERALAKLSEADREAYLNEAY